MSLNIEFYKIDSIFDEIIKTNCFHSSLFRTTIMSYHKHIGNLGYVYIPIYIGAHDVECLYSSLETHSPEYSLIVDHNEMALAQRHILYQFRQP